MMKSGSLAMYARTPKGRAHGPAVLAPSAGRDPKMGGTARARAGPGPKSEVALRALIKDV